MPNVAPVCVRMDGRGDGLRPPRLCLRSSRSMTSWYSSGISV